MSAIGTKQTWAAALQMSAFGVKRTSRARRKAVHEDQKSFAIGIVTY